MAIAFSCPHCGELYRLKDDLAGKRVTCRKATCRKVFAIPTNAAKVSAPVDAEALAAAALAEEAAVKQPTAPQKKIKVTCQYCDHTFEVDASMAGKNVRCPECGKIVKAPALVEQKPIDWRTGGDGRPTLAKREKDPALDGAWDAERTFAKRESLEQAGAIPKEEEAEPVPIGKRIRQIVLLLAGLGLIAWGAIWFMKSRKEEKAERSLAEAVKDVENADETKTVPQFHAAIYRAAAEHRLRNIQNKEDLEEGEKYLLRAVAKLRDLPPSATERNGLLIEVAELMPELGGPKDQVDQDLRRGWADGQISVKKHLRQTLQNLPPDRDLKMLALRKVARKLGAKGQADMATALALEVAADEPAEAIGQIGLELFQSGQKDAAQEVLKRAGGLADSAERASKAPALTALRLALGGGQPAPAGNLAVIGPPEDGSASDEARLAYAEGLALAGQMPKALAVADFKGPGDSEGRVRASAAVASVALESGDPGGATAAEAAARIIVQEMRSSPPPPWLMIRVAGLAARAGKVEAANAVVEVIGDDSAKSWAKLEVLRGRLAAQKEKGDDTWLDALGDPSKPKVVQGLGREELARHNAAVGEGAYAKIVDAWPKAMRAFGQAGTALGEQDRRRKP
jgi:tetratricopeptide (TPR) repeat protein